MTDDLERRLRTWMHADGDVPPAAVSQLAASVSALPARDRGPSPALALAAVLALIVALGVVALRPGGGLLGGVASPDPGAALGPQPPGTPGSTATASATPPPKPPDPAAFRDDPRLSLCGGTMSAVEFVFEMRHAADYRRYLPAMLLAPELDVAQPALVAVYRADTLQPLGVGGAAPPAGTTWPPRSLAPGHRDLCVVVGAEELNIYSDVDITGMRTTVPGTETEPPAPSSIPTPTATKASAPIATLSSVPAPTATSGAADPRLTCGGRSFPVTALDAPTGAEHAVGPEYDALRATLARDESEFPLFSEVPWQLASRDADGAIFLARRDPIGPPGWVSVEVVADANGWQPLTMQECELFMVPSAQFGPATLVLDDAFPAPTPDSTELRILVLERRCSSGSPATGRMSDPLIGYTAESVTVTIGVRPLAGDQDCIGFPGTPALVRLTEPLGDRSLLDGAHVPPAPLATPSPTARISPSAPALASIGLGHAPPTTVQTWLERNIRMGFRPLSEPEARMVRVSLDEAKRVALSLPPEGYGTSGARFVWTKVGCAFLGYYKEPLMPRLG